ncbi:MAG: carbohydrate kinase [Cyanobacteria bacterium P01_C01_bin.120]
MSVICLGELLIDRVVDRQGDRQSLPGGAPANVAVALSRLGLSVAFMGAVGNDVWGDYLAQMLQSYGIDCQGLQRCSAPTRIVEVHCADNGDRRFGGFIGESTTAFADAQIAPHKLPLHRLQTVSALITGTLGMAYPVTRSTMMAAVDAVKARGSKLIIDVNWRSTFWPEPETAFAILVPWLQQADVIKLSVDDAMALFLTADLTTLISQLSCSDILLTDGERGCQYVLSGHAGRVPGFEIAAVETTGAGDAFLAGIVHQLLAHDWHFSTPQQATKAVQFANAMGALTTLKPGAIAAQPTAGELLDFLHAHTDQHWTIYRV